MDNDYEYFVTIFDKNFLPQALLMQKSLLNNLNNSYLYMICLDKITYDYLCELDLKNCEALLVSEVETTELLNIKNTRTSGEYAWTLTPFLPSHIFNIKSEINRVTYLDADLWFLKSPMILIDKFINSKKNFLVTPHDFEKNQDISDSVGNYCVQFMCFTREASGFLNWWQSQCLEWCFARLEKNRFGDQKYLDQVPKIFPGEFYELTQTELTQGPWNTNKFEPDSCVFYHFHGLRIVENIIYIYTSRRIRRRSFRYLYLPYIEALREIFKFQNLFSLNINQISAGQNSYLNNFSLKILIIKAYNRAILRIEHIKRLK